MSSTKNAVYPLFATPLMVSGDRYAFSEAEQRFLSGLEMTDNVGNSMSVDDQVLDHRELKGLRRFIDDHIRLFKANLLRIREDNEIYITQSWVTCSHPGDYHPKHRHPNSVISGVLYLDDETDDGQTPIRFHRTLDLFPVDLAYDELNEFNASSREFDPERGMLVLFPSSLEHDVEKNRSQHRRRSLSFNTYIRGVVGGKEQLTRLDLS